MPWEYIIPGICAIIVALIEIRGVSERKQARQERDRAQCERERTNNRAVRRAEESLLSMKLMNANCKLAVVTAKAVLHQHVNGDVEEAMEDAKDAQAEYEEYIRREAANQTVKL